MAKKFFGVIVPYDTVKDWYLDRKEFFSFIFQQQRNRNSDSDEKNEKNYTLIAYPVDEKGKVLKGASIIDGLDTSGEVPITRHLVNHAHMTLDRPMLNELYKDGRTSNLYIEPKEYYKIDGITLTDYMAYEVITYSGPHKLLPIKRALNPSPPA